MLTLAILFSAQILVDIPVTAVNPNASPADVSLGDKLYGGRCAGCHGPRGDGGKGANLAVAALPRSPDDLAMWKVIRFGIPETEMPAHNLTNKEIWQITAFVRTLGHIDREPVKGNPGSGKTIVLGKGGCVGCHIIDGKGGEVGPALDDIGERRSASYLRQKLLDPNQGLSGFHQVHLTTKTGAKANGVRMNEDLFSIQLRTPSGKLASYWKDDLADLRLEQKSLMPSYRDRLSSQELEDVVAYLNGLKGSK